MHYITLVNIIWTIIWLMWTTQLQSTCNEGQLVWIWSKATNESRVVCFTLEAALVKTLSVYISRAVWWCVAEALFDEILLQNLYGASGCHELLLLPHHHQSHCHHVHPNLFRTTIFSERDKSAHVNMVVLSNVYVYYTMNVGEWNDLKGTSDNRDSRLMWTKRIWLLCPH